jgi:hypothetical protein
VTAEQQKSDLPDISIATDARFGGCHPSVSRKASKAGSERRPSVAPAS